MPVENNQSDKMCGNLNGHSRQLNKKLFRWLDKQPKHSEIVHVVYEV